MAGIQYTQEQQLDIRDRFLEKFGADPHPFSSKLKTIKMSKGGYSYILNQQGERISKKLLETMRAYLENRAPKWASVENAETHFYCFSCETVLPVAARNARWTCNKCHGVHRNDSRVRNPGKYREKEVRYRLQHRTAILIQRRRYYLRKNYGTFAQCVELINKIKQEFRNVESSNS